jgi:hypothetical protein
MLQNTNADQRNGTAATEDVLKHHQICIRNSDLSALMADYDVEAKFFTPNGILRGSESVWESSPNRVCPLSGCGRRSKRHRLPYLEGRHRRQPL